MIRSILIILAAFGLLLAACDPPPTPPPTPPPLVHHPWIVALPTEYWQATPSNPLLPSVTPPPTFFASSLPPAFYLQTLAGLEEGYHGWTVPWAAALATDGHLYLDLNYGWFPEQAGTATLFVIHLSPGWGDGDWSVDLTACRDYRWPVQEGNFSQRVLITNITGH